MIRRAIKTARAVAGALVDQGLERFAQFVCERYPGNTGAANSTDTTKICGYVIPDRDTGDPYITRILFPRVFGMRPMLHHIHRPDYARDFHDHPWDVCVSLILRGSYDEERPAPCHHDDCTETVTRRVRWFNVIRDSDWHRITELHGNVWTLFIAGERTQPWGFRVWNAALGCFEKVLNTAYRHKPEPVGPTSCEPAVPSMLPMLIDEATGDALEALAFDWFEIERKRVPHPEYAKLGITRMAPESDPDLRERIREAMRARTR